MTSQAKKALDAHLHFEVKKIALRQAKDGFAVTVLIHPNDLPTALLNAPHGTRYMAVLVEIGDDESPIKRDSAREEVRASLLASDAADRKNPKLSVIGKERYAQASEMERARMRAGRLAKDQRFRDWASEQRRNAWREIEEEDENIPMDLTTEDDGAKFIREYIGADSRAEIAGNQRVYNQFIDMETQYYEDTGQMAEQR